MDYWQQNTIWLQQKDNDLLSRIAGMSVEPSHEVKPARNGLMTLRIGQIQIHSSYDPAKEADIVADRALDRLPANATVVVNGLGLGYLAEAVLKRFPGRVVVVEPDLKVLRTAMTSRDLRFLSRAEMVCGTEVNEAVRLVEEGLASGSTWKEVRIVQLAASLRLQPEFFGEFSRLMNLRRNLGSTRLSILVNTPVYGGSLPVARYCANAFERLGHRVEIIDNSLYNDARLQFEQITSNRQHQGQLTGMMTSLMAESITAKALDTPVDLVFSLAQSPFTPPVLKELKARKIPTAFWFVEDWQLFTYWREWAPLYDYFFTIQKGEFNAALERLGVNRVKYLPLAADPEAHRPMNLSPTEKSVFGSAVSHVGAGYRNRQQVFSGLTDLDFKLWGNDWSETESIHRILQRQGERLSTEDSMKVFNSSAINLNLHSSSFHDGVNPEGDFVNPRTFELAACGAFQLVDRRSLLPELFQTSANAPSGEIEMATFDHESELRGLIEHYLAHPEERTRISENARRRVLAEHTYEHRMAEALSYIFSFESIPASRRHPDHIDNLLVDAQDDYELRELLLGFKDSGVITLEQITAQIRDREGEINQTEAAFLLMYEFRKWAEEKELV